MADPSVLRKLNQAIRERRLHDGLGRDVRDELGAGLVDVNEKFFYPIVEGIPQMMSDECIDLSQLGGE